MEGRASEESEGEGEEESKEEGEEEGRESKKESGEEGGEKGEEEAYLYILCVNNVNITIPRVPRKHKGIQLE